IAMVLSIRVPEHLLQFEGQTKSKLGSPEARSSTENVISEQLSFYLAENGELSQQIIRKAIKAREAREAARKAKEERRTGKKARTLKRTNCIWWRGTLPAAQQNKGATASSRQSCRFEEK